MAKYKITFPSGAGVAAPDDVSRSWNASTPALIDANRSIGPVDAYDDFAVLKIQPSCYERLEGTPYGIQYDSAVHGSAGEVITRQQKASVQEFMQQRRGFGLLADPVGSGKTYEACTVLSEICYRGGISNLLLVVPEQVYDEWINVLELRFGLGEGVLYRFPSEMPRTVEKILLSHGDYYVPACSMIVKMEDFVKWPLSSPFMHCLYDVVVVDEAHHLAETGDEKYAGLMYRLSLLTNLKKSRRSAGDDKHYCLLLSATPHSGNLEKMFPIWYFIRTQGGDPEEFRYDCRGKGGIDGAHDDVFLAEWDEYMNKTCLGAKTVAQLIDKVTLYEMTDNASDDELALVLAKHRERYGADEVDAEQFARLGESEKLNIIREVLAANPKVNSRVMNAVAFAYHRRLMGSIMVRNHTEHASGKKKMPKNIFLYPTESEAPGILEIGDGLSVDLAVYREEGEGGKFIIKNGERLQLSTYAESYVRRAPKAVMVDITKRIFERLGITDESFANEDGIRRCNLIRYYTNLMSYTPDEVKNVFYPVVAARGSRRGAMLNAKIERLRALLKKHASERVLVFFDYDRRGMDDIKGAVCDALMQDAEIRDRLIIANKAENKTAEFNGKENAVFLACHRSATEGTNLQASNIVINMQVTVDPVAMEQRIGRVFRMGQKNDVTVYSIADMTDLEGFILMFFSNVKLLSANSGDATIIAGSSSGNMIAIRCNTCGSVKLISEEEYEQQKRLGTRSTTLFCTATEACKAPPHGSINGTRMEPITVNNFLCTNRDCGATVTRDTDGYSCLDGGGTLAEDACSEENGIRCLYCHKICVMSHCKQFAPGGKYSYCPVIKAIKEDNLTDEELRDKCRECPSPCPESCRYGTGRAAVESCATCLDGPVDCTPRVIDFNSAHEATCPVCGQGVLRIAPPSSFTSYIKALWDFKLDPYAFTQKLEAEAKRVGIVTRILETADRG